MRFQPTTLSKYVALALLSASVSPALAQSAGDKVVSVGWFHIMPQDHSQPLQVTSPFSQTLAGSGANTENIDTLGLSINYFLTDNWALTLDVGLPPKYKLNGSGTLSSVGRIGTAKQWSPTVLVKYYFFDANTQFRPLVGLGVSHLHYSDIELTDNFQRSTGRLFLDPTATTTADLNDSWAPVFLVGGSYAINKDWYAGLSLSYLKMKSTANLTTTTSTLGTVKSTTTLDINPFVAFLSIGYRF